MIQLDTHFWLCDTHHRQSRYLVKVDSIIILGVLNKLCLHKISMKGYNSIKVLPTPMEKLLKPGLVLPSGLALSYQGGVGGKNDTFLHTSIVLR